MRLRPDRAALHGVGRDALLRQELADFVAGRGHLLVRVLDRLPLAADPDGPDRQIRYDQFARGTGDVKRARPLLLLPAPLQVCAGRDPGAGDEAAAYGQRDDHETAEDDVNPVHKLPSLSGTNVPRVFRAAV